METSVTGTERAASPQPAVALAGQAGEQPPREEAAEGVEEAPPVPQQVSGNLPDARLEEVRSLCQEAESHYREVMTCLQTIKASEQVLKRFQAREGGVTPQDVEKAKTEFNHAKGEYIQAGNALNQGIRKLYPIAKAYPEDRLLQNVYKTMLAKLLTSLETRNPPEPFVELLAMGEFHLARKEVELTGREEQRGMTPQQKAGELLEETRRLVNMLECRYEKRQIQNRRRLGEAAAATIQRLKVIAYKDPDDLRTPLWLAQLTYELFSKERNQNKKVGLRDDIMEHCQKAFSMIDDYLTLQGIEALNERDRRRASYVKTITSIRRQLTS